MRKHRNLLRSSSLALLLLGAGCDRDPLDFVDDAAVRDASAPRDLGALVDAGRPADQSPPLDLNRPDAPSPFLAMLDGIWLVGWTGHLNHYSWVRISVTGPFDGVADYNDGRDLAINGPFWPCTGRGAWAVTQKPDTIQFIFAPACNLPPAAYTFSNFVPPGNYPMGALLEATLTGENTMIGGYKFPSSQCNADMTKCIDPL